MSIKRSVRAGRLSVFAAAVLVLCGISGCGGARTAPVSGVIKLDGRPAPNISVTFTPPPNERGEVLSSSGLTDEQGRYSLKITLTGKAGAVVGQHQVTFALSTTLPESDDSLTEEAPGLPPQKYAFDVPPGGSSEANFELSSKTP